MLITVANRLFAQTTHVVKSKTNFAWWVACGVQLSSKSVNRLWGLKLVLGTGTRVPGYPNQYPDPGTRFTTRVPGSKSLPELC